jgi:hypothetical protein
MGPTRTSGAKTVTCEKCGSALKKTILGCAVCSSVVEDYRKMFDQLLGIKTMQERLQRAREKPSETESTEAMRELASSIIRLAREIFVTKFQETLLEFYGEKAAAELLDYSRDAGNPSGVTLRNAASEKWLNTGKAQSPEAAIDMEIAEMVAALRPIWMEKLREAVNLISDLHSETILRERGFWTAEEALES